MKIMKVIDLIENDVDFFMNLFAKKISPSRICPSSLIILDGCTLPLLSLSLSLSLFGQAHSDGLI